MTSSRKGNATAKVTTTSAASPPSRSTPTLSKKKFKQQQLRYGGGGRANADGNDDNNNDADDDGDSSGKQAKQKRRSKKKAPREQEDEFLIRIVGRATAANGERVCCFLHDKENGKSFGIDSIRRYKAYMQHEKIDRGIFIIDSKITPQALGMTRQAAAASALQQLRADQEEEEQAEAEAKAKAEAETKTKGGAKPDADTEIKVDRRIANTGAEMEPIGSNAACFSVSLSSAVMPSTESFQSAASPMMMLHLPPTSLVSPTIGNTVPNPTSASDTAASCSPFLSSSSSSSSPDALGVSDEGRLSADDAPKTKPAVAQQQKQQTAVESTTTTTAATIATTAIVPGKSKTSKKEAMCEFFMFDDLGYVVVDHHKVPKHTRVNKADVKLLMAILKCRKHNLPKILLSRCPVARYYAYNVGDVVRVQGVSREAGMFTTYSVVAP